MHVSIIHHGRAWRRVENHMRARYCAECGATVHDSEGQHLQKKHEKWHAQLAGILQSHAELDQGEPVPWTAAVDERDDPEALDVGLQAGLQRGTQPVVQGRTP